MSAPAVYLASDVHLGAGDARREARFSDWLRHAGERAGHVVINGDLFDFWFEYRHAIPRGHTRVLGTLAGLVDNGVKVTLMGGNHDWWGGAYLREEVGVEFLQKPTVLDLAGRRTLLAHGDGLGRGDIGYRVLRAVLRGRWTQTAFRWLHPDLGAAIARRVSRTGSREGMGGVPGTGRAEALRRWAGDALRADSTLDLVALGHSHHPELLEVAPGRYYLNSGDWITHDSFAVLVPGEAPRLERWGG